MPIYNHVLMRKYAATLELMRLAMAYQPTVARQGLKGFLFLPICLYKGKHVCTLGKRMCGQEAQAVESRGEVHKKGYNKMIGL